MACLTLSCRCAAIGSAGCDTGVRRPTRGRRVILRACGRILGETELHQGEAPAGESRQQHQGDGHADERSAAWRALGGRRSRGAAAGLDWRVNAKRQCGQEARAGSDGINRLREPGTAGR